MSTKKKKTKTKKKVAVVKKKKVVKHTNGKNVKKDVIPLSHKLRSHSKKKKGLTKPSKSSSKSKSFSKSTKKKKKKITKVSIVTLTIPEIKKSKEVAAAASTSSSSSDQQEEAEKQQPYVLLRIKSKVEREKIYKEAARAISEREKEALPAHGGRLWKCDVKVTDVEDVEGANKDPKKKKKGSSTPLFCWYRGKLELACLPHILEDIPVMSEGIRALREEASDSDSEEEDPFYTPSSTSLQERKPTTLSTLSLSSALPHITRTWLSPDYLSFPDHARLKVLQHAEELLRRDTFIDKVLHGYGPREELLHPTIFTKKIALETGLYRFWRDGLWVVGQEEDWLWERKAYWSKIRKKRTTKIPKHLPSDRWKLPPHQIEQCYNATIDHYHKIMHTVKARGLFHELSDGFDLFRERGRGRYDMELPVFDTAPFHFLTDARHAPWMEIVRRILGDDAELVHKGAFLSLPGSEAQIYHQDGVHLHQKVQKPCHALNVFIPLVDLEEKNGPTEFCLGTHILGNEDFCTEMLETPCVKAGTPILFDYRLGHRGMGNSSGECRPVVYLTYRAGGMEFRDSKNFSRKRYRKIGTLVEEPLSREERWKKRVEKKEKDLDCGL